MLIKTLAKLSFFFLCLNVQSCQIINVVTAQGEGELSFIAIKDTWEYAAKLAPPGLVEQVVKENIDPDWIGDPKRFQIIKIDQFGLKSLYFIDPYIPCPQEGCKNQELWNSYHPLCGATGGCSYFLYIQENGQYRKLFGQLFWRQGEKDNFLKISRQVKDGLPTCLELIGFDGEVKLNGLPSHRDDQRFVSRYCYDGREYVLDRLYLVPMPDPNP